ncbi:hypothetical protein L3Y34_016158 [Caenorhabditis briggsae]|uniref:Polynucleotide adenylyltransferase n=1 Tax=Caenorhabditis briggsae TaxID=6238 RepID=A0AAE9DWM5_CAEBR|nr:hypothetical protein L3Y34_016158 [Caenorhabditis briggsae]
MNGHNEVPTTSKGNDEIFDRIPTHFLVELTSLDELAFPANSTKRVKYTCVASTSKCLCLGTSTGSVYIFSRYAAKSRSRTSSPVPVQVFTTRDGQISTISVSASEELMAIGGDSGRVSIAQLNNGQPPTLIYSTPGDARSPDRVMALAWSPDMKTVYSGHSSGSLHCHRLNNRSVFRAAHQKLTKFDGEIVQLDTLQGHVLVATSLSAHLYHVDSGTIQQVGKKVRTSPSPLGACYIQDSEGGSAFIVAARPNGRLWEANLVGVVYKISKESDGVEKTKWKCQNLDSKHHEPKNAKWKGFQCRGRLMAFGSYRLGVHGPGADIDCLVLAPRHVKRSDFFQSFKDVLAKDPLCKNLQSVEQAYVPIMTMKYDEIEIDLLFCSLDLPEVPEDLNISDDSLLKNLDQESVRSLNGAKGTEMILKLVPNQETFALTLRAVKIWAKNHGIYSNAMGYLGGISWALLVARVCQLYPNAAPAKLIQKFFFVFSSWIWPSPILLKHLNQPSGTQMDNLVWSPRTDRSVMPILTPTFPSRSKIQLIMCQKARLKNAKWEDLFEPTNFFTGYKHFVAVTLETEDAKFQGFFESKIRQLVQILESDPLIAIAHINPRSFKKSKSTWFIGMDFIEQANNLDLTRDIERFKYNINQQASKLKSIGSGVVDASYVKRSGLIKFVPAAELTKGRSKMAPKTKKTTHQYRQSGHIPRAPPISYRNPFPTDYTEFDGLHPDNQDVSLHKIHVIRVENGRFLIVSTCGSRICIVEMETSKCILSSELDFEILDVSTCGNDVFVLLADSKGLRKFSVFEREKCVEKLNLKGFFGQSAQTILFCSPHFSFPSPIISKTIEGLLTMSRKKETERLQQLLQKILDDRKASQSMYDNMEELERRESLKGAKNREKEREETQRSGEKLAEEKSKRLPSGVHRVLHTVQCSGYDDDFSFSTPQALRERSRSSPCTPESPIPTAQPFEKRASEPSSLELRQEFWRKNGTPDVVEEDILHRARQILEENSEKLVEKESLRTLLQLEGVKRDEIRFTPTVTIGNAAKALAELALAVPVDLSTIWNNKKALAMTSSEKSSEKSEKSEKSTSTSTKKPTIVKVVRPGIRPAVKKEKPVATVSPRSPNDDVIEEPADDVASNNVTPISEEMRRKQDEMWLDLRLSHIKKQSTATPTDSNVPKSDTDYTITTEGTTTPTTTPSGIWTNPLDEEEDDVKTPTTSSGTITTTSSEFNCTTCGMHRSWAAASLLMAVSSGAEVIKDDFRRHGSIPQTSGDWERLLRHVALSEEPEDLNSICPRCEMSLSTVERVCIEGWRGGMVVEEGIRPNFERIFERCMNSSKEKLETIVARREEQEPIVHNSGKMKIEEENRIQKDQDSETSTQNLQEKLQNLIIKSKENIQNHIKIDDFSSPAYLRWLQAVPLKTLLALAVFTLGKKAVIQIISSDEQWIAKRMKPADWCSIVVIGTRETVFKDLLGVKIPGVLILLRFMQYFNKKF